MKVNIKYMGQLRKESGVSEESIVLDKGATVKDLMNKLCDKHGDGFSKIVFDPSDKPSLAILCFVDDEQKELSDLLNDDQQITLMSPISGG